MNYNNFYQPQPEQFIGYYVNDYSDVTSIPSPMNGSAIIFADLNSMMLYSKKNINGIPTIQPYKLSPIYQEATKPTEIPLKEDFNNDTIKSIMEELKSLKNEISTLRKDDSNESK